MTLTPEQQTAFTAINQWLQNSSDPEFVLNGYAGTGKSTLVAYLIEQLGLNPILCTPTAKAALVLRTKLKSSTLRIGTIHSYLYQPTNSNNNLIISQLEAKLAGVADKTSEEAQRLAHQLNRERRKQIKGNPQFALKEDNNQPKELVIVDEASMVTAQMRQDLFARSHKILYVGDSAQLPPVGCVGWFHKVTPDANLFNTQRQALDSPIIRLAQSIRQGVEPTSFNHPGCVMRPGIDKEEYLKADQVIIGTNAGRHKLNRFFRQQLWGPGVWQGHLILPGEKLLCKQNQKQDPLLVNGNLFRALGDEPTAPWVYTMSKPYKPVANAIEPVLMSEWEGEGTTYCDVWMGNLIHNYYEDVENVDRSIMLDHSIRYQLGCLDFDYGYGITVHAAQGSEWDKVILCDDWAMNDRQRWLYTAVTRAKSELVWVKKE